MLRAVEIVYTFVNIGNNEDGDPLSLTARENASCRPTLSLTKELFYKQ